jgi:hypothetical protein
MAKTKDAKQEDTAQQKGPKTTRTKPGKNSHKNTRRVGNGSKSELRPIKRRRRKRVRLGEAFRKAGLDEQTVAETYVGVVEKLRMKSTGDTVQKLLVDVLKECSRLLEPPRSGNPSGMETPTIVELHHNVPRPAREMESESEGAEPL